MTNRNAPLTVEIPAYLVDSLEDYVRLEVQLLRTELPDQKGRSKKHILEANGDMNLTALLTLLKNGAATGPLAEALEERAAVYEANRQKSR